MKIFPIITIPNPILKQSSFHVQEITKETKDLIENLKATLHAHPRCVGIAAVQVGILQRIIIVDVAQSLKEHRNNGLLVMINPDIKYCSGEISSREGCLSVPNFVGNVVRKKKIEVEYLNINGDKQELKTSGFEAIVIQHEIDHLNGKVFLDRVISLNTDVFRREN
ncbi:MAG: peptide deformylase [Endomicrobium sp.]|jgi:peptide deformylase|uniref:peptide deformylase n=1 Tax=Candidatus Endomicrobiellum cubanum TaxID=3242325 RepID=UPI00282CB9AA|nr:peptide deformylase [Endomicrobium sp.]